MTAAAILALRKQGKRPADMVLLSFERLYDYDNPVCQLSTKGEFDYRFLHDLDVTLIVNRYAPPESAVHAACNGVIEVNPRYFALLFERAGKGFVLMHERRRVFWKFAKSHLDRSGYAYLG